MGLNNIFNVWKLVNIDEPVFKRHPVIFGIPQGSIAGWFQFRIQHRNEMISEHADDKHDTNALFDEKTEILHNRIENRSVGVG